MANSDSNAVTVVGILAILLLVGLAFYFVMGRGDDSELEIDLNGQSNRGAATHVAQRPPSTTGPEITVIS